MEAKSIHFLGICGTAMGALASAMARQGYKVSGCDSNVYPPMSTFLEQEGIPITQGYAPQSLPRDVDYIVIGNAMSRGNEMVEAVLESRRTYMSMPEAMKKFFLWNRRNYVVTGTHGKTTTTSMLAWLMEDNALNPSFMIGGIARNLGRGGRFTDSPFCVLEGDEYDTAFFDKRSKFLHYLPELAIVNNIELDHIDIFNDLDEIKRSFELMMRAIPRSGLVLMNADCPNCLEVAQTAPEGVPVRLVGLGEHADVRITDLQMEELGSYFVLEGHRYFVPMAGEFNVRNAAMAILAALHAGISPMAVERSLAQFEGIARRQELRGTVAGVHVVDDFAHHPTAVSQAIDALRQKYPSSRIWALFDPRSNTSGSNLFAQELADALSHADCVVVAPVERSYKYTEETILQVPALCARLEQAGIMSHAGESVDEIVDFVSSRCKAGDVLLVMSNGGFGKIHDKLLHALA